MSDEIVEAADEYLRIPMCGMVESLNVSASAAILIYMLSQRMRLSEGLDWQIEEPERQKIMLRWMMTAVRDSKQILERKYGERLW